MHSACSRSWRRGGCGASRAGCAAPWGTCAPPPTGWTVEDDAVISTVIGDIALDLRDADLPEGETELAVLCWLGTIQVRVPRAFGVDVTAQAIVGSVDVLGEREEGVVRDIHVRSEGYESQTRRVRLRLSTFVGELMVVQV